jgi:hypothetical protein
MTDMSTSDAPLSFRSAAGRHVFVPQPPLVLPELPTPSARVATVGNSLQTTQDRIQVEPELRDPFGKSRASWSRSATFHL